MFGDVDKFEKQIEYLVANFPMWEILEMLDITPEQCLSIQLNEGHADLPPYLDKEEEYDV